MKPTANQKAGIFYLLAVLVMLPFWFITLFVHNPPSLTPSDIVLGLLTEAPNRLYFWWLLFFPTLSLLLAAAYFSRLAQARIGAISFFSVGVLLALTTWLSTPSLGIFASLPLLYSFVNCRQHLTHHSRGTR